MLSASGGGRPANHLFFRRTAFRTALFIPGHFLAKNIGGRTCRDETCGLRAASFGRPHAGIHVRYGDMTTIPDRGAEFKGDRPPLFLFSLSFERSPNSRPYSQRCPRCLERHRCSSDLVSWLTTSRPCPSAVTSQHWATMCIPGGSDATRGTSTKCSERDLQAGYRGIGRNGPTRRSSPWQAICAFRR
jgi:hypothetical protein